MMRFALQPEPPEWDVRCRTRGRKWLGEHPNFKSPHGYWTVFEPDLRRAFRNLCAYCAMVVMKGEMDHFVPVSELKKNGQEKLIYEWTNFRYGDGWLNQKKLSQSILDPFEVEDDWFEITRPSLQLLLTDKVPHSIREKAEFTLKRLGLQNHEVVIRYRQQWFELYRSRNLDLAGLFKVAPLIARAVEKSLQEGRDWRRPESTSDAASAEA